MDIKYSMLPEWNDERMLNMINLEGEEWKYQPQYNAAKQLYEQWRELFGLSYAFAESMNDDDSEQASTKTLILQNIFIVAPKLLSAASSNAYFIQMENAAIIRQNCNEMITQVSFAVMNDEADESYKLVIEESLQKFKKLFKIWVSTFVKDEYEDDWGLFS